MRVAERGAGRWFASFDGALRGWSLTAGRSRLSLLAVSMMMVLVGACAGGDTGPTEPREVDVEEWGRETCRAIEDIPDPARAPADRPDRFLDTLADVAASFERGRDELELLIPPREVRRAHRELVDYLGDVAEIWRDFDDDHDESSLDDLAQLSIDAGFLFIETIERTTDALAVVRRFSAARDALVDGGCL